MSHHDFVSVFQSLAVAVKEYESFDEREQTVIELGYALSSEEHAPNQLLANAQMAERVGFKFLLISDHFHPWVPQQGQSSFVWSVFGGIAQATQRVRVGT